MRRFFKGKHDSLIEELLKVGLIVVSEVPAERLIDDGMQPLEPRTVIYLRHRKTGKLQEAKVYLDGFSGAPRIRVSVPNGTPGKSPEVKLSVRRVVWIHFRGRTLGNICPIDGDQTNYNIWNLVARDQGEQNWIRIQYENPDNPVNVSGTPGYDLPF